MKQAQATGKRIVSKGEYARIQGKRAGISAAGVALFLLAAVVVFGGMCAAEKRWTQYARARACRTRDYKMLSDLVYADKVNSGLFLSPQYVDFTEREAWYWSEAYSIKQDVKAVSQPRWWIESLLGVLIFALCTYLPVRMALASMRRVENMTPGVPLTRANTGDLPESDSLVRASLEPIQTQERHEEQLLRSSAGGQK